jgi:hypothetical protein
MVDTKTVIQTVADHKGDDDIFAYQASDDSMERAADVERLGAVTLDFL